MNKRKKDVLQDALLSARELEQAAKRNAHDALIEAFTPRLTDVIRQTLNEEGPGPQLDDPVTDLAKGEEEETESSEVQNDAEVSDGHPEDISPDQGDKEISGKGKKHDLDRSAPQPGQMTEEEDMDDEDMVDEDDAYLGKRKMTEEDDLDLDDMEEGEDHDVGKLHFDDRDAGDSSFERGDGDLNEEEEMDDEEIDLDVDDEAGDDEELDIDVGMDEEDEPVDDEDDSELDIPAELFDDEEDMDDDDDVPVADMDGGDEELPLDEPDDDLDDESDDEEIDLDVIDDEEPEMEEMEDMPMGDEEFEEGLYLRREGEFEKVDPEEALQSRIDDLEEERQKLANAVGFLKGQLGESTLLNAKLAHLVRLYESGLFSKDEKRRIAERLDEARSVKRVKTVYNSIVKEAGDRTVLDDIHDVITESRSRRSTKPTGESVYESDEVRRMKRLAGLDD